MKRDKQTVLRTQRRDLLATAKIISPIIALIAVGIYFEHFVVAAILSNLEINGLIIATIIYGTCLILARLMGAQKDFSVIEQFGKRVHEESGSMHALLNEPWMRQRYIRHYLTHVAQMKEEDSDQHAIESELAALNGEYNSKLELPQFLVGFMIALGLLGTFIGLLETLTGISGMLDGIGGATGDNLDEQFMLLVGELRKPLAGMGIAFSASMFGLVGSIALSIMMINLRRYVARVLLCARNVMHDITEIQRKNPQPRNRGRGHGGGGGGSGGGAEPANVVPLPVSEGTGGAVMMLASRIDMMLGKFDVLFKSMEASISSSNRTNDLLGFGPRMKETGERTLDELKAIVQGNQEATAINSQSMKLQHDTNELLGGMIDLQRKSQMDTAAIMRQLIDAQKQISHAIAAAMQSDSQIGAELISKMKTQIDKIAAVEDGAINNGRHLWELREIFGKMGASLSAQEASLPALGQQSMLMDAMLNELRHMNQLIAALGQPAAN
jgi:hypothetical protein